jgi:hypothetical protein
MWFSNGWLPGIFKHPTKGHEWSKWETVPRVLIGPYGRTVDTIQQRVCKTCGFVQRSKIPGALD